MGSKSKSNQSSSSQNVNSNQGVNSSLGLNYGVNQSGNYGQSNSNNFGFNQGASQNTGQSQNTSSNASSNSSSSNSQNSSSSQTNQDVWGAQSPFLEDVYGQAQNAFTQGMDSVQGMTPEVQQQMQQAFQQAQGGFGSQMGGGFASGLQGQIGPNSYVDAMKGQVADDANTLKQQNLGSLDARAAAAGMSGSSGYRDQVSRMQDSVDENAMNQMANIGFQAHDKGIQNQMNLANMRDQNQQFGTSNLQNMQQGAMNQFNPAMVGQQMAGQYAQTIGGPTTLTDSSSQSQGTSTSQSQGSSLGTSQGTSYNQGTSNNLGMNQGSSNSTNMGFSNGMNVGMNQSGGYNNGYGYGASNGNGSSSSTTLDGEGLAAGIGAFTPSDVRLKENIEHVDQIDGINMYTWDWKDEALSSPMSYGVIAQEVAETHPEAVVTGEHGYMMVDYSKLGRAGEAALSRMED